MWVPMKIEVDVPDYDPFKGVLIVWEEDVFLETDILDNIIIHLKGNRNGLISLAKHLLTLAEVNVPTGSHIHYDEWNSLEKGSFQLIIEKIK
jgi:hypothetical protein